MSRDALVVGLNSYAHLPDLKTPAEDAEAIARTLEESGGFRVWRFPEAIENSKPRVGRTLQRSLQVPHSNIKLPRSCMAILG